eukprot:2375475-Amphidinium_carterae.2
MPTDHIRRFVRLYGPDLTLRTAQAPKPHSTVKHHQVDEHGNYEVNMRWNPVCRAYNKGEC